MSQDTGWQSVPIPGDDVEDEDISLEIEDEDEQDWATAQEYDEDVEVEIEEEDDEVEDVDLEIVDEDAEDEEEPEPQKEEKASRSQKRIRQLNEEKKKLAAELAAERAEKARMAREVEDARKNSYQSRTTTLEATIKQLQGQVAEAFETGDTAAFTEAQSKLTEAQMHLIAEKAQGRVYEQEESEQKSQTPTVPQAAQDWLRENRWFYRNREMKEVALGINDELLAEGYNPDTEVFFEELTERMKEEFPDKFKDQEEDDVDDYEEDEEEETPKQKAKKKRAKAPVGSSKGRKPRKKNSLKLTRDDLAMAQRMNLSPLEYAKSKQQYDDAKKTNGGWTSIET